MEPLALAAFVVAMLVIAVLAKSVVVVPQQNAYVVEHLGRCSGTLHAGFHTLIPFVERVAHRHSLKEHTVDIDAQSCITRDNVQLEVDGILYLQVLDAERASYGIDGYRFAISQLAQTALRSEIGKINLDRTFLERKMINTNIVNELDKAADPWGVKVLRYEIQNVKPPSGVVSAMEKEMRAEREKRAVVLKSEGARQLQINEAEGQAAAILTIAEATADGLRCIGAALEQEGGNAAMQLRVAEQYLQQFGELAKQANTLVVPANLADISAMVALATRVGRDVAGATASVDDRGV